MKELSEEDIISYVEMHIQEFHRKRLDSLLNLKLKKILQRKNPYLFRAKSLDTAHDLVKSILDAHLSSQEEGIFGGFLEELAIYVCSKARNGRKSPAEGIDMEFDDNNTKYIISIKSGPNWGNSRQIARMKDDFRKARRILGTNTSKTNVVFVNGCCYGKDDRPEKGDYRKLCGQRFWEFISGNASLYIEIIEPLGYEAKKRDEQFLSEYAKVINKFTFEFSQEYCAADGAIMWEKLVKFNSGQIK